MAQLDDIATGSRVGVSNAEAPYVMSSGRFSVAPGSVMVAPDGERFNAPADSVKVRDLLSQGWRVETATETRKLDLDREYRKSGVRTFFEGAASGATFGLSDALQTSLGLATPEELSGRRAANPEEFAAGEVAGFAGSLLLPGAAATRVGKAVAETAIGKGAITAFKGISAPVRVADRLGTAAGAGAEKAIQAVLPVSAGSGAMAKALSQGTKFATQGIVDGALFGAGELVSERALGDTEINAERIMSHIGLSVLANAALGGTMGAALGVASPAAKAARKKIFDNLDKIPGVSKETASEWLKQQSHRAALASVGSTTKMFREIREQGLTDISPEVFISLRHPDGKKVLQEGMQFDKISKRLTETTDAIGSEIGATIDSLDAAGVKLGIGAGDIAKRLGDKILRPLDGQVAVTSAKNAAMEVISDLEAIQGQPITHRWLQDQRNNLREAYVGNLDRPSKNIQRKIEREFNEILEESAKKVMSPREFAEFKQKKDIFHSIKTIEKNAALRSDTMEGNRFFSLSDRITAGATAAGAIGSSLMGDDPLENTLYGLGGGYAAQAIARQFRTRSPSALAVLLSRASRMMAVEKSIASSSEAGRHVSDAAAEALLGNRAIKKSSKTIPASIDDDVVRSLIDDPGSAQSISAGIQENLGDVAPEIASFLTNKIMLGVSFLASKYPRDSSGGSYGLTPNANAARSPGEAQRLSYDRYVRAVDSPASVIEDIARGEANNEGLEVLKALYPVLKNDIAMQVIGRLAESSKPLPYNKRVALAVLLGIPNADPTAIPQFIAAMQASYAQKNAQMAQDSAQAEKSTITNSASQSIEKSRQQNMPSTDRIASGTETY